MPEGVARVIEGAGIFLSLSSVLAIVIGLLVVFSNYLYHFRRLSAEESFRKFKPRIARVLMVALEILVVADIIETVTTEIKTKAFMLHRSCETADMITTFEDLHRATRCGQCLPCRQTRNPGSHDRHIIDDAVYFRIHIFVPSGGCFFSCQQLP